jgi:hypothetical protein
MCLHFNMQEEDIFEHTNVKINNVILCVSSLVSPISYSVSFCRLYTWSLQHWVIVVPMN